MIGFTKLLCGDATVSRALKQASGGEEREPRLLQFTTANRPLVVWNMTLRCNLSCVHCYNDAGGRGRAGELTTAEAEALIDDLAEMGVPVLLFSGGEPVLRPDLCHLGAHANSRGVRPVLSTNGTLLTAQVARGLAQAGLRYVGVSVDGLGETHDRFRSRQGAFDAAWQGIACAQQAGLKTGVRFTVTRDNLEDLPGVLEMAAAKGIDRFCLYHLVYSGRGTELAGRDLSLEERRNLVEWLVEKTEELHSRNQAMEILTTDNHADGIYLLQLILRRDPARAAEVKELLRMHGGCSAGKKFANIDVDGNVHPCQFWGHQVLGNVRERRFSEIWNDPQTQLLCQLREMSSHLSGKCRRCCYRDLCGGCRVRAEAVGGGMWKADPACYLTDKEISCNESQPRS